MMHASRFVLAQSLVEYGALGSIVAGVEHLTYSIRDQLASASPTTWLTVGGIVLIGLVLWSRRSSRL